jgi:hypothetical protein
MKSAIGKMSYIRHYIEPELKKPAICSVAGFLYPAREILVGRAGVEPTTNGLKERPMPEAELDGA